MPTTADPFDSKAILEAIRLWVEIESPTDDRAGVDLLMSHVAGLYRGTGARIERIPGHGFGDHLIARSPWGGDAPGILVLSHLDTVHPSVSSTGCPSRSRATSPSGPASTT